MTNLPHHIIAIGASAGGLDELNLFFDHTPLDGVSYVIVQHLSPDFKSRMVELLSRHSKLMVKEAKNGMAVKSNEVYLIPNDKFMLIRNNSLFLTDKKAEKGPHLTIDRFLTSLASNSGGKAIAVILSGLGSDGSEGTKAIKNAGGMVIARNPDTSEFSSMPAYAIATGVVDFVLEPELMPATIEEYLKHDNISASDGKDDGKNIGIITNLINAQLPLDFSEYKHSTILRRIKRRADTNNFSSLERYIEFLKTSPEEIELLARDFLISVTSFFRDKEAYAFLQSDVLPDIIDKLTPDEELKLWVAGCATGEEAYSLAILLHELLAEDQKNVVVKIFATDIDSIALVHASKGIYPKTIAKDVSPERLEKHFIVEGDTYRVDPGIRKMVIFANHDLVKNPPYCNMQLISCRNLLIYMTPVLQRKIFSLLLFGLKMNGYLFLGSSESPVNILPNLDIIHKKWKIYRNIQPKRFVSFDAFSVPVLVEKKQVSPLFTREDGGQNFNNTLAEALNATLVKELYSLLICVDEKNMVVKSYGDTTKFLLQKNFTANLTDLLPRPFAIAFNTLSTEARKTNNKATLNGLKIQSGQDIISVTVMVMPLDVKKNSQKYMLMSITEEAAVPDEADRVTFDEKMYLSQYTQNLEEEVSELKEKLQAAALQIDSSNENMQSFNEELLSANEEMQSTNEEMQSVNEELHTINADYQLKNKELLEVNDDLNNYFRSNINGQLFVNKDLRLMKFSPGTVKQINLLPTDIGRPLSDITTNIKFETLLDDIKKVLTDKEIITKEIETENSKWYQVMTMPYVQQGDIGNSGAIVTFNDITELKKVQRELDKKNESLLRINADLENFVNAASHDLVAPLGNIELSIDMMNQINITDPKLNQFLTIINSSVKKFRGLINDISKIAKIENEMTTLNLVDIDEIITNVEWSLENKIKTAHAVIRRNLEIRQLYFSKKNLRSILYNLISNCIKFKSSEPPVIFIETVQEGDEVVLSVQDNGIGIAAEDIDKIFAMYGRLNQQVEGQGIGLYLAKKIVDAAGGNIKVKSEPGKGTSINIYLKATQTAAL